MKTRKELVQFRSELVDKFNEVGVVCRWMCETGTVIIRRNGTRKLTFSLRDERTYKNDIVKMRTILDEMVGEYKLTSSNQFGSSRPEFKLSVTLL